MFNIVKKENTTTKTFSYALVRVSLKFTLRVDTKRDLKDFLQCLKSAQLET